MAYAGLLGSSSLPLVVFNATPYAELSLTFGSLANTLVIHAVNTQLNKDTHANLEIVKTSAKEFHEKTLNLPMGVEQKGAVQNHYYHMHIHPDYRWLIDY